MNNNDIKKVIDSSCEENNANSYYKNKGVNISLNLTKIFETLIVNHFYVTLLSVIFCIISYMMIKYNISLFEIMPAFNNFIIEHFFYGISAIILILILVAVLCIYNKIIKEFNNLQYKFQMDTNLAANVDKINKDIIKANANIDAYMAINNAQTASIGIIQDLLYEDLINTKRVNEILDNINNTIQKIPQREIILDFLNIKTKLLFNDIINIVCEYLSIIISIQPVVSVGNGANNIFNSAMNNINLSNDIKKISFYQSKISNKFEELKNEYVNEVYNISKNILDINVRQDICNAIDNSFKEIIYLTVNPEQQNTLDEIIYNIDYCVKQLTVNLLKIYSSNLKYPTLFN